MSRAERRRAEREARKMPKRNAEYTEDIATAILKNHITSQVDKELHDKYYEMACKEKCDNTYYIILCSLALALHDCNPSWGCNAIGKRLCKMMEYVDRFPTEYGGDLSKYLKAASEITGIDIEVDSVSKESAV